MLRKTVVITLLAVLVFQLHSYTRANDEAPALPEMEGIAANITAALSAIDKVEEGVANLTSIIQELRDEAEEVQKKQEDGSIQECDLYKFNYLLGKTVQQAQNQMNTLRYPTLSDVDTILYNIRYILNPSNPYGYYYKK
ncbi:uncharacterized protein [Periplaneta americana]|uniref:uncharacterized protein n=1 Tax=Periplaneta americana TaxID=6978 RepID=UPI0037E7994F